MEACAPATSTPSAAICCPSFTVITADPAIVLSFTTSRHLQRRRERAKEKRITLGVYPSPVRTTQRLSLFQPVGRYFLCINNMQNIGKCIQRKYLISVL